MSRLVEEETDYPVIRWFAECEEMRLVEWPLLVMLKAQQLLFQGSGNLMKISVMLILSNKHVSDVSPKCLYEKYK